jgi:nucleoid-associated protein YgaU
MSFFKKDEPKKKADFSNVSSGSSTTGTGRAPSPSAGGGAKPDFSNVRSGGSSTAPTVPSPGSSPVSSYVVKSGDSLSRIAKRLYGDAKKWPRIYEANKDLIGKNPDLIQPGQNLVIPQD